MISKRDVQLGKIALKEKMVSKEQINKALKIKKKLKTKASLGAILVKKGYISKEQLEIIVSLHNSTSSQSGDDTTSSKTSGRKRRSTAASKRRKAASAAEEKRSRRRKTRSRDGEDDAEKDSAKSEKAGKADEAETTEDEAETTASAVADEASKESRRSKRRKTRSKRSKTGSKRRKTEEKAEKSSDEDESSKDEAGKSRDAAGKDSKSDSGKDSGDSDSAAEDDEDSAAEVDVEKVKEETREATKDRMAEVLAAALLSGPTDDDDYDTGEDDDEREKRKRREREMESGQFLSAALFKSAAADESDEYDSIGKAFKKIIACKDCGKKYRIKPSQAGKKFKCRRCKSMVRVPEDYFEDDAVEEVEPKKKRKSKRSHRSKRSKTESRSKSRTSKRKKKKSPKVEEFDLSELDDDESGADEESKSESKSDEPAEKPEEGIKATSYRDLARAAVKAPKAKPKQAAMTTGAIIQMILFTLLLVAVVGGFYGYKKWEEQQARARFLAALKAEWDEIEPQISGPAKRARAMLEDGENLEDLTRLTEAANACQGVLGLERQCAYPQNRKKAEGLIENEYKVSEMRHKLLVRKALILERSKDFRSQEDAIRAFNTALGVDAKVASTWTRYALALAKARRWSEAVEATNEALKLDDRDEATVLAARGFIYELGGASRLAADTYERLVAIKPFAAILRARALIAAGARQDAGKVLDELQGALTEDQGEQLAIVHIYRARSAAAGDDLAAAEAAARKALAADDKSPWPALELGRVLLGQGRYLDARNAFTDAETKGGVRRAALGLGKAHLGALNLEEALAALRRAASGSSTEGSTGMLIADVPVMVDPLDMADPGSEAYRQLGDIYRARGELDLARTSYQEATAKDPWSLKAHAALADLMLVSDDTDGAGYEVELALRLTEGIKQGKVVTLGGIDRVKCDATAYVLMVVGSHAQKSGNLSKAENALDLALDLHSGAEIMTRLASVRSQRNQRTNSRADYRNALGKERGDALYQQATAMLGKDGPDGWRDAIAASNALLASNPHFSLALTLRGMAKLKLDKREGGLADLDRAIEINPQNKDALLERGLLHSRGDKKVAPDWAAARRDFEAVIAIDPTRARARLGLAEALHLEGRPRKALEQVNEVLKIEFNNKAALLLRAKIYRQLGDVKKAEADERKAAR